MPPRTTHHAATLTALLAFALAGCDEPLDEATIAELEHEAALDDELELLAGSDEQTVVATEYFRLMSKQTRLGTPLCFEPLENVSGSPVLQRACSNGALSENNPQAWLKSPSHGYRIQYGLKQPNSQTPLCLHIAGGVKSISDGPAAVLYPCETIRPNQHMLASPPDVDGAIALMAEHSHRCLNVFGALTSDLALLYQFSLYTGAASCAPGHQRWYLRKDDGTNFAWTDIAPDPWAAPQCVL